MKLSYNDRQHAYWLDGHRCKGVTTVAGYPDDTYNLDRWRLRQVAVGLAVTPALVTRAAAHFDERDKLDDIAEEAIVAAKAHEASGHGTAVHRITERVDLGLEFVDTPLHQAIRTAWLDALDRAGLDIIPELTERVVVYPDELVAGRCDRIARRRTDGALVIVDVKTGENAFKYPHKTAIQLGLYANAPFLADPLTPDGRGGEHTTGFKPMPTLDLNAGYIVYLPSEGLARVFEIDIAAGWEAATTICFPTISWRRRQDLVTEIDIQVTDPPATRPAGDEAHPNRTDAGDGAEAAGRADATPHPNGAASADRTHWLLQRIAVIVDKGLEPELAAIWHLDLVPAPLYEDTPLTDHQVDAAASWCAWIEGRYGLPFEATDPAFLALQAADHTPQSRPTPAASLVDPARDELARHWVIQAKTLLADFDETEVAAILAAAYMDGTEIMTQALYERLEALVGQVADPNGVVILTYDADGPAVVATTSAKLRLTAIAGSGGAALNRAARIAKQAGRIAPRSLKAAAEIPLYAALVAAGHGTTNNQENNTT